MLLLVRVFGVFPEESWWPRSRVALNYSADWTKSTLVRRFWWTKNSTTFITENAGKIFIPWMVSEIYLCSKDLNLRTPIGQQVCPGPRWRLNYSLKLTSSRTHFVLNSVVALKERVGFVALQAVRCCYSYIRDGRGAKIDCLTWCSVVGKNLSGATQLFLSEKASWMEVCKSGVARRYF